MKVKSLEWALRGGAILAAAIDVGCSYSFTATDGTVFKSGTAPLVSAELASGAHDLPCGIDKVHREPMSGELDAVSGCGWRIVYRVGNYNRIELVSRSPLTPGGDQPSPASGPAPSNPPSPAPTAR